MIGNWKLRLVHTVPTVLVMILLWKALQVQNAKMCASRMPQSTDQNVEAICSLNIDDLVKPDAHHKNQ